MRSQLPPKIMKDVEDYIREHNISDSDGKEIMERVRKFYRRALYDPEEAVGVVTAQSLSEPATQMTMRTYHFAGTAGIQVTLGLPRLIEIFDAKKEPETPSMTIYLKPDYQTETKAIEVAKKIKEVKLRDFVLTDVIDLVNLTVKCRLDSDKLKKFELEPKGLIKHIKLKNIDCEVKGNELTGISKKMENVNLHKLKYKLLESHIKGVKGVSHVIVSKDEKGEWFITTLGSNLKKVFDIDGVDYKRTVSNNPFEIYDLLGVEAARNSIIREAIGTIEEQGLGVDIRYVTILADLMTSTGKIMGIGRYGIAGNKDSVLARMAFEETKKHIISASVDGLKDPLKGHVENIIMNQLIPMGTGAFDLIGRIPEGKPKPEKPEKMEEKTKAIVKKPKPKKPVKKPKIKKPKVKKPAKKPVKKPKAKKVKTKKPKPKTKKPKVKKTKAKKPSKPRAKKPKKKGKKK
ncbi:MAG: DNA-directed RNA polymerase subunit A'' [Candidatus Aenigmarchaeota archaeon]|nr:DNA-directed RNA polymerase subunit A'' [Candidatus Aenigmarchaeota archaeon]